MPVIGGGYLPKMGPQRRIFVAGADTGGDALNRAMGENYHHVIEFGVLIIDGEQGTIWTGSDRLDGIRKQDRDVLLRLAKAGIRAREISDEEFRAAPTTAALTLTHNPTTP